VPDSDEVIFKRAQAGNREAFAILVGRYQRRASAVATRLMGSRTEAEDVVQQAFLRLYESRASYSPRWRFNTWFYRIIANTCVDGLRRLRPTCPVDGLELSAPDSPEGDLVRREQYALLQAGLAAVPIEARIVLTLYYGEGKTYREIAAIRGIAVNTVKTHLRRGRALLRKALRTRGVDGP
jgi:RNA polymerase sigma-70 factor (ECF subfamily)